MSTFQDGIPNHMRQSCKVCGRRDYFAFDIPDDVWAEIVPEEHFCHAMCLTCFDDIANEAGKKYAASMRYLYFAGNAASFCFVPKSAIDLSGAQSLAEPESIIDSLIPPFIGTVIAVILFLILIIGRSLWGWQWG